MDGVGVTKGFFMCLEGVRSVGAHGELELEEQFIGGAAFAILGVAQLCADQAELAGQISQLKRTAGVLKKRNVAGETRG